MEKLAVVGAGITGLVTALLAARAGLEVTVYEEHNKLGRGASGHNAGVIHVLQPPPWKWKSRLAVRGNREYDRLAEAAGFRLMRMPAFLVYMSGYERALALAAGAALRILGYSVSHVGRDRVLEACPDASKDITGALEVKGYATVLPMEVLEALARLLGELGVEVRLGDRVEHVGPGVKVVVESRVLGTAEYDYAVIASGPSAAKLAAEAGFSVPRLGYYKGVMVLAKLECGAVIAGLRSPSRTRETKGGGVIPWPNGRVLLGPTFEETGDPWDTSVGEGAAEAVVERYADLLDYKPEPLEAFAGTRVKNLETGDFSLQVRGSVATLIGIDSPGFTAAPALARETLRRLSVRAASESL